ncbi:MAG: glycine zipper domain-containing protein, partial [Paracoccaceae bacterium]
ILATLAAVMAFAVAAPAQADYVAEKALRGAVAGAAIAEVTGGDAAEGAAAGAVVGATAGAVQKNDFEDRHDNFDNDFNGSHANGKAKGHYKHR